ncbi:uncharacterized protein [Eurosta solidaginis]|uniref:uncharacterized protein n=1 Tax=Eurosta solidaginis TaxID=178769 RepID=UPI003530E56C
MDKFVTRKPKISKTVAEDEETSSSDEASKPRGTKRKFREEWLKLFDWLKEKEGGAFCVGCSKTLVNHSGHLKAHEKMATHIQFYESRKKQCTLDNFYNKEHQKQQQQVRNAELTLVMFCIAHNLPFLLMDSLPALLVECFPDSSIAKLIKCGRTKSTEITEYISKQASEQIFSFLRTNCFSFIVDETTDVSLTKSLVLVARKLTLPVQCRIAVLLYWNLQRQMRFLFTMLLNSFYV